MFLIPAAGRGGNGASSPLLPPQSTDHLLSLAFQGGVGGHPLPSPHWEPSPEIWKTREEEGMGLGVGGDLLGPDETSEGERKI